MSTDNLNRRLFEITKIILTEFKSDTGRKSGSASGFYFTETTKVQTEKEEPKLEKVEAYWLITNKHVLFPSYEGKVYFIDKLVFCLRTVADDHVEWVPIEIRRDEIIRRTKLHVQDSVDVVAIDVTDFINHIEQAYAGKNIVIPQSLTSSNLPENQPIKITVTTDVIVASYPKAFYDTVNKYPIVKSGIVASGWGLYFRGDPVFEIDAQLFPGSSGGLVLSKPTNIGIIDNQFKWNHIKQYVLLGIYSGEYKWEEEIQQPNGDKKTEKRSYGLGNVWYSFLIPQIINDGKSIQ